MIEHRRLLDPDTIGDISGGGAVETACSNQPRGLEQNAITGRPFVDALAAK